MKKNNLINQILIPFLKITQYFIHMIKNFNTKYSHFFVLGGGGDKAQTHYNRNQLKIKRRSNEDQMEIK